MSGQVVTNPASSVARRPRHLWGRQWQPRRPRGPAKYRRPGGGLLPLSRRLLPPPRLPVLMATSVYEEAGLSHCHAAAGRGVHGPSKYSRPLRVHSRFARLRDFVEPRGRPATLRSYRFSSVHVRAAVGWHRRCAECGGSVLHCVISPTCRLSVDDRRCGCRSPRRGAPVTLRPTCAGFGGNQARADFVSCRSLPAPCNKHTQDLVQGVSCKCGVCGDRAANRRSRRSRGGASLPRFSGFNSSGPPAQHVLCVCIIFHA